MCTRVQSDVLRVPVFSFCTCLWRHVFGVLRVLCVLLGLYVLDALCALYALSKPYVQHRGPQKRASGQKRTDGSCGVMRTCVSPRWGVLLTYLPTLGAMHTSLPRVALQYGRICPTLGRAVDVSSPKWGAKRTFLPHTEVYY